VNVCCAERFLKILTIILHVQRLGRIILADPSIMIHKPKIIILFQKKNFARGPKKRKDPKSAMATHGDAGQKKK